MLHDSRVQYAPTLLYGLHKCLLGHKYLQLQTKFHESPTKPEGRHWRTRTTRTAIICLAARELESSQPEGQPLPGSLRGSTWEGSLG